MNTSATWPRPSYIGCGSGLGSALGVFGYAHDAGRAAATCDGSGASRTGADCASGGTYSGSRMYTSQPQRLYLSTYPGRQPGTSAAAQGGGSESVGDAWPNKAASRNEATAIRSLLSVLAEPRPSVTLSSPQGESPPGAMTTTVRRAR